MPLLIHTMQRTLTVHGQAIQLTAEAYSEIADIDHLLHFAQSFLQAFAHFIAHQFAEVLLVFAEFITQLTNHFSTLGRRPHPPFAECLFGGLHDHFIFFTRGAGTAGDQRTVHRTEAFDPVTSSGEPVYAGAHTAVM